MLSDTTTMHPKPAVNPDGTRRPAHSLTVSSPGTSFPADTFGPYTNLVLLSIETADCLVTFDGSVPAIGNGHTVIEDGAPRFWAVAAVKAARFTGTATIYASEFQL